MKIGSLVCSVHDKRKEFCGIVTELGTSSGYGKKICRVHWFDGDQTYEFCNMLEVISEDR